MFGKGIFITMLAVFVSALVCSCGADKASLTAERGAEVAYDPEKLERDLEGAPEIQALIAIRDDMAALAIARNVTADEIRATALNASLSNGLLGFTEADAQAVANRIDELIESLYDRFPALSEAEARSAPECEVCDLESIASSWEHLSKTLAVGLAEQGRLADEAPAKGKLVCKMTQLVLGMGLCAAKSGANVLFYSICSYGVFCGACDGGVADVICP
ncbi:MAG: hypothetical protein PHD74_03000 [Candidatus Krumholzibacteria bacterium]|nr:hypothetical protein [Candidatus Krumholzibacteria bacterium]